MFALFYVVVQFLTFCLIKRIEVLKKFIIKVLKFCKKTTTFISKARFCIQKENTEPSLPHSAWSSTDTLRFFDFYWSISPIIYYLLNTIIPISCGMYFFSKTVSLTFHKHMMKDSNKLFYSNPIEQRVSQ